MGSQNPLETDEYWSNHEIMPKLEDEVFSFQYQLPPLDFRYPGSECSSYYYDLDANTYLMDMIISNNQNPICSPMGILPDPTLYEDGFLVGRDYDELGFPDQEMFTINSFNFPNQQVNSLAFPNDDQEMHITNTLGFSSQTQLPKEETSKMVRFGNNEQLQKKIDKQKQGDNGNNHGDDFNYPSRSAMGLTREMISQCFYMPIREAAEELNIGVTLLKKRCREFGIHRWPYRKLMSLHTLITNVQELRKSSSGNIGADQEKLQEAIIRLEKERKKMEEIPDLQFEDKTKRLRQACFKANYKKRKIRSSALTTYNPRSMSSSSSTTCVHHETMEDADYAGCFSSSSNAVL